MGKDISFHDLTTVDFAVSDTDPKYITARLIRMLVLYTNRHKLDYGTIRYIHREVIKRTKLAIPRKSKKLYELPTPEELDNFFESIDDPQIKLLFQVILNCGLRVSEVVNLYVSKIDFQTKTLFITGKGNKDRIIPITNKLADKIQLFLSGKNNRFLFESKLGTQFSTRRIEQLCQHYKEKSNLNKKFSPHTLRHYYFSKLAEIGLEVNIRAMLAGHSNSKTQDIYTHIGLSGSKETIIEALEKLEEKKIFK